MAEHFQVIRTCSRTRARLGCLKLPHGEIPTPVFMPVGTQGSVKALAPDDLQQAGVKLLLGNTYHLYLRPGLEIIREAGGLHSFMNWQGAILTDSGGFQVFSLADLRIIDDEGVNFRSHLDGSRHYLNPERSIHIQRILGADICMVLDECVTTEAPRERIEEALARTHRWAEASLEAFQRSTPLYGHEQMLFGIVQGGIHPELREASATFLTQLPFQGYAIGGLSVGESKEERDRIVGHTAPLLPRDKPRYLMGVGKPEDIVAAVSAGVDMFDCVLPTRNGRNGTLFTWQGPLPIKAGRFKNDFRPVDENCGCYTCRNFTRAYLRHLFNSGEPLVLRLASLHNVFFYQELMRQIRTALREERFDAWRKEFLQNYLQVE